MGGILALKIDVCTLRGAREGVPRLMEMLRQHGAQATFLFSLGPDRTGRAIRHGPETRFGEEGPPNSTAAQSGWRTLLYGKLLPAPDIGRNSADLLRGAKDAGFEAGIHGWDHLQWQDDLERADAQWTRRQMERAKARFEDVFGEPARTHGAAGWQMNRHALRLTQGLGFDYCSDSRGRHPFMPVYRGEIFACPQIPTTLPTLDELIGRDSITQDNIHEALLGLTEPEAPYGHVYTLRAELEGMKLAPVFERLLEGWGSQGYDLTATRHIFDLLDLDLLPRCEILRGEVPGRSGTLMVQGDEFLHDSNAPTG